MHLLVDLGSERQIDGLKAEFEDEVDVLYHVASPIWQGGVIQQPLTGHLNGTGGRNVCEVGRTPQRMTPGLSLQYGNILGKML